MRIAIVLLCLLLALPAWGQTVINGTRVIRGDLSVDGDIDIGTIETFSEDDPTPDVSDGSYFNTGVNDMTACTADCITDFDGTPADGDIIVVNSQGAITFDCTGQGLDCGTTDIVTAAGDTTFWAYDGTDWNLIAFADQSDNLGVDAGAAGGDSVSIDSVAVVDPDFVSTGQVDFTDTANTVTADINDDTILEADLKAVDAAGDEECLTFEATGGDFEWQSCASETNDLEANDPPNVADTEVYIGTGAGTGAWAVLSGDATMTNAGVVTVVDDSHAHVIANVDSMTSAALAGQISNESGTGLIAMTTNGVFTTPALGTPSALVLTNATGLPSSGIVDEVRSMWWGSFALHSDSTQCADPAEVTIGSWGKQPTIICTDNDASIMTGAVMTPDSWDAGTFTVELAYIQDAADTGVLNVDVSARCVGAGETPAAYGTEVAIDDAAVTGTDAIDMTTSGAVTAAGTCAAGDYLQFQFALDATGTTTAAATLNFIGGKVELTSTVGD